MVAGLRKIRNFIEVFSFVVGSNAQEMCVRVFYIHLTLGGNYI